jgi:hypothetical protein
MLDVLKTRSLQTSVLAGLLFYVFANPGMYKMIRQFPGLKFVMKGATEITHQGTMVNAVLFGLVMLLCVHLINSALIKDHLKFLNVVEHQGIVKGKGGPVAKALAAGFKFHANSEDLCCDKKTKKPYTRAEWNNKKFSKHRRKAMKIFCPGVRKEEDDVKGCGCSPNEFCSAGHDLAKALGDDAKSVIKEGKKVKRWLWDEVEGASAHFWGADPPPKPATKSESAAPKKKSYIPGGYDPRVVQSQARTKRLMRPPKRGHRFRR